MSAVKIISGVISAAVIFIALGLDYFAFGGDTPAPWAFTWLVFILVLGGQWEFYSIVKKREIYPLQVLGIVLGAIYFGLVFIAPYMTPPYTTVDPLPLRWLSGDMELHFEQLGNLILVIAIMAPFIHFLGTDKRENAFLSSMATTFGLIYVVFLGTYMVRIRAQSFWYAALFVCTAKSCDIGAYFTGSGLGKHKLHRISPKKTVEGSIGGIVVGTGIAILVTQLFMKGSFPLYLAVIYGVVVSVASQVGDLAESLVKRRCNVKDSGSLIPGSGGLLDFIDCLLFSAPVAYYFVKFILL